MMSDLVENISKIHNNTFIFAPLIVEFFKNTEPASKNILLAYLVLPLVLHEKSQDFLFKASTRSSINTLKRSKETLYGLPERVHRYKEVTNICIQYAIDNYYIKINDDLSIEVLDSKIVTVRNLEKALKASSNLHKVFKGFDVVAIYRLLGVKEL